jgi:fibronectin type 3 domain-containing protein
VTKSISKFTLRNFVEGNHYQYAITAIDSAGNVSEKSPAYSFYVPKKISENSITVKDQKINKNKKSLQLSWTTDMDPTNLKGFVIYSADAKNVMKPITGTFTANEYKTTLAIGKTQFQIRAYTKEGKVIVSEVLVFDIIKENQ